MARGVKLPAAILAAALFALLAFAPFASAAPDPVASGSATITLNSGFVKSLKKKGVKIGKIGSASLKGKKATFKLTGGELDPTNGLGTLTLGGGLKFKNGKKSAPVKALVLDTTKKGLFGKIAGKKVKITTVGGYSFTRAGFGVALTIKKMKLTNTAAKKLNKKLGTKAFKGNRMVGSALGEEQPATVTIVPGNNVSFDANKELLKKLTDVKTAVEPLAPTSVKGTTFEFPISGGSIAPTATAGVVQTVGGAKLFQKLPKNAEETEFLETEITLGNFYVDLSAHTVSVEVVAKSNASSSLNLGSLGRSSIADLTLVGANVSTDVTNRTVTVSNAQATLQPVSAEVLDAFRKVYEGFLTQALQGPPFFLTEEQAKAKAAEETKEDHISAGNPLGTFAFTAKTQ
ncbi:MAG: HtaA domain-containing protein [Solirubrobacterales bacterium]